MRKTKLYRFDTIPRWIKYSGLPAELNSKYGREAWPIFWCLIELDCRYNWNYPNTFDQAFEEIADLTGLSRQTVSKYIELFERNGLLSVKRGKFRGQKSTFKLANPIKAPKDPEEIHHLQGGLYNRKGRQPILRYAERVKDANALQGPNVSKVDIGQVKTRDKQVKDVDHKEKKREENRGKGMFVNQAQAIPSSLSKKEAMRLLLTEKQREMREHSRARVRKLIERLGSKRETA